MAEAPKLVIWPAWMKCPVVDGYGIQAVDRRESTEMDIGSARRVEFDTDECVADCSLFCDPIQANFFEKLERDVLSQGSVWFDMNLWVGGQLERHLARFRDRPRLTGKTGPYTEYSFTLDLERRNGLMDDDLADILLEFSPYDLVLWSDRLHFILHIKAPKATTTPNNIWFATEEEWEAAK